jgi:hypothetical protein
LVASIGQKLLVVNVGVIDGVEEVLQIIEAHESNLVGMLVLGIGEIQKQTSNKDEDGR